MLIPVESAVGTITDGVRRIDAAGIQLADIAIHRPTLDDVFLLLGATVNDRSRS